MNKKLMLSMGMLVLAGQAFVASKAWTADARDEGDMFGSTADTPAPTRSPTPHRGVEAPRASSEQEKGATPASDAASLEDATPSSNAFDNGKMKDNPMDIGGVLYQQAVSTFQRGLTEGEQPLSVPTQFDVYLDSRPNDRVRGYVLGRLLYDSSKDAYGKATAGGTATTLTTFSASPVTTTPLPNNPQVVLDAAWLKFDIERTAFLSVGKQHVKWGTGKIWNPSDALNPQRRDPLQPYDLRLGANMATLQLPWEAQNANLYAIALLDNPQPASTLQQVGGALRIEGLIGPMEVGLDAVGRGHENPRFGADLSTPLGPFDFYAEGALLTGDFVNYQYFGIPNRTTPTPTLSEVYMTNALPGHAIQVVGGLNYTWSWRDSRTATVGVEYMYNELGIDDGGMLPVLAYLGQFSPLYMSKHYAAWYLSAEGPDAGKKTSYNLTTIASLVDKSAVTRLDFQWLLLDYLTFGAHGSVNYGGRGGEFNFMIHTPALQDGTRPVMPVDLPGSSGEAGVSLRVAF